MDALPPSPPAVVAEPPAAHFIAASDIRPRNDEEKEICERGSRPDWLYLGGLVALDVVSIGIHPTLKQNDTQMLRYAASGFIGLTWGATIGGAPLTLPTCDPHWVWSSPPEGEVRARWPLALALSLAATATAPFVVGITTGPLPLGWDYTERATRMWIAAGSGLVGSLLPYVPALSPRTLNAARELERIRFGPMAGGGGFATYQLTF